MFLSTSIQKSLDNSDNIDRRSNLMRNLSNPIDLNLDDIQISYGAGNKWIIQSNDLDTASNEIDTLIDERDELDHSLKEATLHIEQLNQEIIETNDIKNVTLAMVSHCS